MPGPSASTRSRKEPTAESRTRRPTAAAGGPGPGLLGRPAASSASDPDGTCRDQGAGSAARRDRWPDPGRQDPHRRPDSRTGPDRGRRRVGPSPADPRPGPDGPGPGRQPQGPGAPAAGDGVAGTTDHQPGGPGTGDHGAARAGPVDPGHPGDRRRGRLRSTRPGDRLPRPAPGRAGGTARRPGPAPRAPGRRTPDRPADAV